MAAFSFNVLLQAEIMVSPKNTSPTPARVSAQLFAFPFDTSMETNMPINEKTIKYLPTFAIPKASKMVVTVVPIFAPIMVAVA